MISKNRLRKNKLAVRGKKLLLRVASRELISQKSLKELRITYMIKIFKGFIFSCHSLFEVLILQMSRANLSLGSLTV